MIAFINSFFRFPEKLLLFHIIITALIIRLLLRMISYQRASRICHVFAMYHWRYKISFEQLQELTYRIQTTFAILDHCLIRSLTIFTAFKKTFPNLEIKLGISDTDGFQAHAWLENEGQVIDSGHRDFEVIYSEK